MDSKNGLRENDRILEANALIAYLFVDHKAHFGVGRGIEELKKLGNKIYFISEDFKIIEEHLKRVENVARSLDYYPKVKIRVARKSKNLALIGYISGEYINFDYYREEIAERLNNLIELDRPVEEKELLDIERLIKYKRSESCNPIN